MTPHELDDIREVHRQNVHTDKSGHGIPEDECGGCGCEWPCDAVALLAEVDRLTAQDVAVYWEAQEAKDYAYHRGEEDERARILAAMETLNTDGTFLVRAAAIAAIEGETA